MTARRPDDADHAPAWRIVERRVITDCEVFRVDRLRALSPRTGRKYNRYVLAMHDWVNVVAFAEDGRAIMVEQYRFGADTLSLDFPAGALEPGEDPAEGGRRELREETGYEAAVIEPVAVVHPDPALQDNRLHVFAARHCRQLHAPQPDDGEDLRLRLVPVAEVRRMIRDGTIHDALAIAAWFLVENMGPGKPR